MPKNNYNDQVAVERAEFVRRTVKELCELLRAGAPYPELSGRIEQARGALLSLRVVLWQRELGRAVEDQDRGRSAA